MYESLVILEEQGLLSGLVKQGIVSITLAGHKLIYEVYLKERAKGLSTSKAVLNTSIETKTPESVVYKIRRKMLS